MKRKRASKELLNQLYWEKQYSLRKIAVKLDISLGKIQEDFKYWDIPRRTKSESLKLFLKNPKEHATFLEKGKKTRYQKGHKCPPEIEKKRIEHIKGYKHTDEWKELMKNKMIGRHMSLETKEKMSNAKKQNPVRYWLNKKRPEIANLPHCWSEGHIPWNKGLEGYNSGDKNPQWLGGLSFEPYSPEFNDKLKEEIRKRDNHTCQECNYTEEQLGYTLSVHHIDYDKKNNDKTNLISLCNSCHQKTNFNRENWIDYYHNKQEAK